MRHLRDFKLEWNTLEYIGIDVSLPQGTIWKGISYLGVKVLVCLFGHRRHITSWLWFGEVNK